MDRPLSERQQQQAKDPALQLAPPDGAGPNLSGLKTAFETTARDCATYASQCRQNFETRFAIWQGQSSDGKKHSREGANIEPTPWDGASDLRCYTVDEAINAKVAMLSMARRKANLVAVPINGNDLERAKVVGLFLRWLVNTQIPNISREDELLAQFIQEKGVAVTGQFWEVAQEKVLDVLKLEDLQKSIPLPRGTNIADVIQHGQFRGSFLGALTEHYDISTARAERFLKELVRDGEAEIPVVAAERSYPVIRAFNLDEDIFIPPYVTDLEMAPYIFRVQYFTAEKLRSLIRTDGWDADWVEKAILTCKGRMITLVPDQAQTPISRNFVFRYQRFNDLIGVVYAYQRLSDEDNVPGIYLTIFNPDLPADSDQQGYAKHGLLGYRHPNYPFILHRREYLSRRIHDSRGLPEPGKAWQDQIKAHMDSRIDAASVSILPPLMYPVGRPPSKWGPGARIPERRAGEYHYADRPGGDPNTEKSQELLMDGFRSYAGIHTPDTDNRLIDISNQFETDRYLEGWSGAYSQVWKLYQQYGDDKTFFRVIGLQKASPEVMQKGNPREDYTFYLTFDTLQFDREAVTEKIQNIIQVCMSADKNGQTDWSQVLQIALENVDPTIAERIITPKETATQQAVNQEQSALAEISAGIDKDITLGAPPQLGMSVIQNWLQAPDVMQRFQQDKPFQQRVQKRIKQYQMQMTQSQNAKIGKYGA